MSHNSLFSIHGCHDSIQVTLGGSNLGPCLVKVVLHLAKWAGVHLLLCECLHPPCSDLVSNLGCSDQTLGDHWSVLGAAVRHAGGGDLAGTLLSQHCPGDQTLVHR